jgi:hypothetical protein
MEGDTELQAHLARLGMRGAIDAGGITRQRALDKLTCPRLGHVQGAERRFNTRVRQVPA